MFGATVAYAHFTAPEQSTVESESPTEWKRPTEFGIPLHFFAEELEEPPRVGPIYTPEQLGVVMVKDECSNTTYSLYIVDPDKALKWMKSDYDITIRYNGKYYYVSPVHVFTIRPPNAEDSQADDSDYITYQPNYLDYLRRREIVEAISSILALCWCSLGILSWKGRTRDYEME